MRRFVSVVTVLVIAVMSVMAQTLVSGSVANQAGEVLAGSTVIFTHADTIAGGTITDSKGRFELRGLPNGEYVCEVSMVGYKPASQKFTLTEKAKLPQFALEDDAMVLGEVTVTGDARKLTKELAGMSIYYLTDRAKKEANAYFALSEIPRLLINEANREIKLDDGTTPLILINGVKKPLETISPEHIESVEVIDNPSARYRGDAEIVSVLNIMLKKESIKPYIRGEIGLYSAVTDNFLYSQGSIEIGSATSSLYLNALYWQGNNVHQSNYSNIFQGNLHRELHTEVNASSKNPDLTFGGDNEFSKKNYMAYSIRYHSNPTNIETNGHGGITDLSSDKSADLTSIMNGKTSFHELIGNLYFKHSFRSYRTLELTGNYFYSLNGNNANREENSELLSYKSEIDLDNSRHMGKLDAVYSDIITSGIQLEAGSNTEYSVTNIDDKLDCWPNFIYKRTREYLFAGIDNNKSDKRLNYSLSLGLDMVFSEADGVRNSYVDFVPSVSLQYKLASKHNLLLKYNRGLQMPKTSDLNPRNTSTDLLKETKGNPYLTPSHSDNLRLSYVFSNGRIRLNPYAAYSYNSDLIVAYGYLEDDIYVSSYQNLGHSENLMTGASLNYNFPQKNEFFGNLSIDASYNKVYMKGMAFRGSTYNASLNGTVGFRNVAIFANIKYNGDSYSLYSKKSNSYSSFIQFIWQIHNSLEARAILDNFICPRRPTKTWIANGDYNSYTSSVQKSLAPKIQIGVWYTLHTKNFKQRNKKQFNAIDNELKTVTTE